MKPVKFVLITCLTAGMAAFIAPEIAYAESDEMISVELKNRPLQQVAVTTKDLERAKVFYGKTLGLPFLFESNGMAFFDVAGMRLMISIDEDRPDTRPTSILYFDVEDFHTSADRLGRANVELDGPIETVQKTEAGELKIQQFHDPDGNALAIIGMVRN